MIRCSLAAVAFFAAGAVHAQSTTPRGLRPTATPKVITLDDAFARASEQSFDLRIAETRVDGANARVTQAWSQLLPNISLAAEYDYNFPEQKVAFGSSEQFQQQALLFDSLADITDGSAAQNPDPIQQRAAAERSAQLRATAKDLRATEVDEIVITPSHVVNGQLQFSMPLFSGRALPLLQNAYSGVELTRLGAKAARAQVLYGVARIYYQVVSTKRIVEIARQGEESAKKHLELAKQREEAGYLTPLQRQRAELEVARAEMQRRNAEAGLRTVKGSLGAVLGVEEDFDVVEPAAIASGDEATAPERLLERAIAGRDDLRMQRTSLSVADRGSTDSWARFLPSLRLIANGRYTSNTSGLASEPFTGLIGVQASVPLFDGGLAWGSVKESQAKVTEELLKTRQLEMQVEQEVRGSLDEIVLKAEALVTAERVATLARAQLENAERLFEAGAATELDVADARLASFQSDVEASRARFDVEVARLGLQYAIGEMRPAGERVPAAVESAEEDRARTFADTIPE